MKRSIRLLAGAIAIAGVAGATEASAQCRPRDDSNEAKLLAFFSAPLLFATPSAPEMPTRAMVIGRVEAVPIPNAPQEIRRTGACFVSKSEHTDIAPGVARPILVLGLGHGLTAEGSYLPPIRVQDAEPHLGALALSWTRPLRTMLIGGEPRVMLRAHMNWGRVRGAITCPRSSLQQTNSAGACYGTNSSKDTFRPRTFGLEAVAGWKTFGERLTAYGGVGVNWLRPRFQVGFTDAAGNQDRTLVEVELTRLALFSGISAGFARRWDAGLQVYSVPKDVTLLRLGAGYRVR